MLRKLRHKKTAKKIWIVLAALIIPAFVLWGSGSLIRSKETAASAYTHRIFGKQISALEFKDAMDAVKNDLIIQYGEDISELKKGVDLQAFALERLLLLFEAKKRKIKAGDKEVMEMVAGYPFFQKKGRFDNAAYQQELRYVFRTQSRIFEEQTRQRLILSKLYADVTRNVTLTDSEIREAYRKANEQVSIYYIVSRYTDFTKDLNPAEEEIKSFFDKDSLRFKQPLSFNLEYISIPADKGGDEPVKEKIRGLMSALSKNTDTVKVAKEFGLPLKETGLFGQADPIPNIGWSPQIQELVLRAKIGELLPAVYMDKNYYVFRLKERKEPYIPDFPAVKDKAKEIFVKEKAEAIAKEKIENCLGKLKEDYRVSPKQADFDKCASAFGLKSGSSALFKYGSYIEGIGASDVFWTHAGSLKDEEFSEVISTPSGFYIIKVKSRIPPDENKFTAEKSEFAENLLSQKKLEHFTAFTQELKAKAQLR